MNTLRLDNLIKQAIAEHQTAFTTQSGEEHDRSKTIGGSEAWQCARKTYFQKTNAQTDEGYVENKGYFVRGHVVEDTVVSLINTLLRSHTNGKATYEFTGDYQITLVDGNVSATPDGLIVVDTPEGGYEVVVEIKSLDPRSNFDKPKESHVMQAQLQMGLFHKLTPYQPKKALLVYMNSSDFSHVVQHEIEYDSTVLDNVHERADRIFSAKQATDLPAEGKYADECRNCPYTTACCEAVINTFPSDKVDVLPGDIEIALTELIHSRSVADAEIKELTKEKGEAEEKIKTILRLNNIKSTKTDHFSLTYSSIAGRKTLDFDAVEGAGIDLSPYFKQGTASDRLTIRSK